MKIKYRVTDADETVIVKARGLKHAISIAKENRNPSSKQYGVCYVDRIVGSHEPMVILSAQETDNGMQIKMYLRAISKHERAVINQVLLEENNGN